MILYKSLNVPKSVIMKTQKTYLSDPEKRPAYEKAMKEIRESVIAERNPRTFTKEECLEAISFIYSERLEAKKKALKMVLAKAPGHLIFSQLKIAKARMEDELASKKGIEIWELNHNVKQN